MLIENDLIKQMGDIKATPKGTKVIDGGRRKIMRYDTYVPIMISGAGVQPQRVHRKVWTIDVAPTLAAFVGAKPPSGAS